MKQQDNYQSRAGRHLLVVMALVLIAITSCGQVNDGAESPSNMTAIAATVQSVNAQPTPASMTSPINTPFPATPSPTSTSSVVEAESYARSIKFSEMEWVVKSSSEPVGPGPNYFSDSTESVWVDDNGQLHLKMIHKDGRWYCAEVVTAEPLGYGSYQFKLSGPSKGLDKYAVLGLFTWDTDAPEYNYREIDIELSRWGEEAGLNAQFVVQPWDSAGNRHRFAIDPQADFSTFSFVWTPQSVQFLSFLGKAQSPDQKNIVDQWSYTGADIPPAGLSHARINLWLFGAPPPDAPEIEVTLASFGFIPQAVIK